jgi:uncharacterized membrane protein
MARLWTIFLKGLTVVLPVTVTIYLVIWLGTTAESLLGDPLRRILPEHHYWPGLGLVVGLCVVMLAGVFVNAYIVRRLIRYGESLIARIPVIKTIFGALKDFTRFLPAGGSRGDLKRVVAWRVGNARVLGFVTEDHLSPRLFGEETSTLVAVYFPLSYQLGGHTLFVPRDELQATDLSVEEAMRLVILGGISNPAEAPKPQN